MKRISILLATITLFLAALAHADDQTQAVQQALKDQGFYFGEVDGEPGPETDSAVRRYQIRQGLDVTGKLDAKTLSSLNVGGDSNNTPPGDTLEADATPAPTAAPKSVAQSDHEFLRHHATPTPAPNRDDEDQPATPPVPRAQPVMPPQDDDQAAGQYQAPPSAVPADDYARFFRRTPYETAPVAVQRDTILKAQKHLAKEGFYRGILDAQLSDYLSRAIVAYQRDADIPPSGRLDMDTLSDLDLLPHRHIVVDPGARPYYPAPRTVYRGISVH